MKAVMKIDGSRRNFHESFHRKMEASIEEMEAFIEELEASIQEMEASIKEMEASTETSMALVETAMEAIEVFVMDVVETVLSAHSPFISLAAWLGHPQLSKGQGRAHKLQPL